MNKLTTLDWVALILVIVGGLNWALTALGFNLVTTILGDGTLTKIVYYLVGLSALYLLINLGKYSRK